MKPLRRKFKGFCFALRSCEAIEYNKLCYIAFVKQVSFISALYLSLHSKLYFVFFLVLLISCKPKRTIEKSLEKFVLFQATYDSGVGGCSLVFYKDNTCLWMAGIASDDREGKYHIQDSIITLENIPLETCLKSNKLLITTYGLYQKTKGGIILIQVDSKLKVVDSTYIFTKVD